MKFCKSHYILLSSSIFLFALFVIQGFKRESRLLKTLVAQRQKMVNTGWKNAWHDGLLDEVRDGRLSEGFRLQFDRTGFRLKTEFFPKNPVTMPWENYRSHAQLTEKKRYLQQVASRSNSWDRVLGLQEAIRLGMDFSFFKPLSNYESTLVSSEARNAYHLIFKQFNGEKSFTLVEPKYQFDKVFFRVLESGNIEGYVPSFKAINQFFTPKFKQRFSVAAVNLSSSPWQPRFIANKSISRQPWDWVQWALISSSFFLLFVGLFQYRQAIKVKASELSRKVNFLSQVVHELNSPLAGLHLQLENLKHHGWRRESIELCLQTVLRMEKLFSELRSLYKRQNLKRQLVSANQLYQILDDLKKEFSHVVYSKQDSNFWLRAHPSGLTLVLRNLIKNAVSYGSQAEVRVNPRHDRIILSVIDRGPGVAANESKAIFSHFFRSESVESSHPDGLGIGLSAAKKYALAMNGSLRCANPGKSHAHFILELDGGMDAKNIDR